MRALKPGVRTKTASKAAVFCHLPTDTLILMCLADGCGQKDRCGETERSGFRKAWQARRAETGEWVERHDTYKRDSAQQREGPCFINPNLRSVTERTQSSNF